MPTFLSDTLKSGISGYTVSAAVTAGTNTQGQSPITSEFTVITTSPNNPSGVTLPTAVPGKRAIVVNRGANQVNVYPAAGARIDSIAINSSIELPVNGWIEFNASSGTQWYSTYNISTAFSSTTLYKGTATVDFGVFPGNNEASVQVTGQGALGLTPKIKVFVNGDDSTADHSVSDHRYLPIFASFSAGNITAGQGFTIYCRSLEKLQGTFKLTWEWSN